MSTYRYSWVCKTYEYSLSSGYLSHEYEYLYRQTRKGTGMTFERCNTHECECRSLMSALMFSLSLTLLELA